MSIACSATRSESAESPQTSNLAEFIAFTLIAPALLTFCAMPSAVKPADKGASLTISQLESALAAGAHSEIPAANMDTAIPSDFLNMNSSLTAKAKSPKKSPLHGD
jgi:hypothetical protein